MRTNRIERVFFAHGMIVFVYDAMTVERNITEHPCNTIDQF